MLDEHAVPAGQAPAEAGDVRGAETRLARAMQHMDVRIAGRELVGDLASAVRAVVVDDEHVSGGNGGSDPAHDRLDVVALVVGRDDDGYLAKWLGRPLRGSHRAPASGSCGFFTASAYSITRLHEEEAQASFGPRGAPSATGSPVVVYWMSGPLPGPTSPRSAPCWLARPRTAACQVTRHVTGKKIPSLAAMSTSVAAAAPGSPPVPAAASSAALNWPVGSCAAAIRFDSSQLCG